MSTIQASPQPLDLAALDAVSPTTPYFVFQRDKIIAAVQHLSSALPVDKLHYAVKCNPHPEILRTIAGIGAGFEIASVSELNLLLSLGVDPDDILFSAPVKSVEAIVYAYQKNIKYYTFDSPEELIKLSRHAPGSHVTVRLKVNDRKSVFSMSHKFGIGDDAAVGLMVQAKHLRLVPYGVTFHVGSQAMRATAWSDALRHVKTVVRQLQRHDIQLGLINLGGGFPIAYQYGVPSWEEIGAHARAAIEALPYRPRIVAEPGRALVAHSASLVAGIIHRTFRENREWAYLDVGAYNGLLEVMAYQGSIRYPLRTHRGPNAKSARFVVTGPTCDSLDTIEGHALLPHALAVGERLYIDNVGAYTTSLANSFNGFAPPEVFVI